MTKLPSKTVVSETQDNAEQEARAFTETKPATGKKAPVNDERAQAVSEGKRVFTEVATDVPQFNPVYAPQIEREEVDIRAAQGQRAEPDKE